MPDYLNSNFQFSETYSKKRMTKAQTVLGADALEKLLAFALFLLGAKRESIAEYLRMPQGTLLSFLTRVTTDGLPALEDRRAIQPTGLQPETSCRQELSICITDEHITIPFGTDPSCKLTLPKKNVLQCKTVLLSLMNSDLVSAKELSEAIGLSSRRIRDLGTGLQEQDVIALQDKRTGQTQDYRVGPTEKAELIQQFAARAVTGHSVSSEVLTQAVNERTQANLSPRTVRLHLSKLGLAAIKSTIRELVDTLKKNSSSSD